ncbi:MAG: hypothetical protein EAX87_02935 [Candidatus Thorarchaeota archaeon]|nr:hypothetical protein [Candidatus Thorarchaeota archaeon]
MKNINGRQAASLFVIAALFASFLAFSSATPVAAASGTIVFDYSHGQAPSFEEVIAYDAQLGANLTAMGYTVVWARGGINASILSGATGLVMGSCYGANNGYTAGEISAIGDWFNAGNKFLWVGYDSDYTSLPDAGQWIDNNMTLILEAVHSDVYGEPTAVEDPVNNGGSGYRVVANKTSTNPYVADIVSGVTEVLMHGPTCLYGASGSSMASPVALETTTVTDVYPILYTGGNGTINDGDATDPIVHTNGQQGSFVMMAMQINAGDAGTGNLMVSGASPYGDYQPMYASYYNKVLDGYNLVKQAIDFGMQAVQPAGAPINWILIAGVGGAAVVVIIIVVYFVRKR